MNPLCIWATFSLFTLWTLVEAASMKRQKRNGLDQSLTLHPLDIGSGPKLLFQTDTQPGEMMLNVIPEGPKMKAVGFTKILAPMVKIAGEPGGFKNLMEIFQTYMDSDEPIPNPFGEGTLKLGDGAGGGLGKYMGLISTISEFIPSSDPNVEASPIGGDFVGKLLKTFLKPTGPGVSGLPFIGSGNSGQGEIVQEGAVEMVAVSSTGNSAVNSFSNTG